jgi:Protein of unknown function (DUF4876)
MKKILLHMLAATLLFTGSCKKDKLNEVVPIEATFQLNFTPELKDLGISLLNTEVTITNKSDGKVNKAKSDENGKVVFASIAPGNYSVVAALLVTAADYSNATGTITTEDIAFNGSAEGAFTGNITMNIELKAGKLGDWIIKQVYYGGSSTSNGALFRDQFIEIYNNSNQTLYADSLYVSQVFGKNTRVSSIDTSNPIYQSNGQLNWANALNMTAANPNTNFVYLRTLWRIPGSGKEYPVKPGESIIIAQNGLNHKASYIGANGTAITVKDPSLTVDLSKADFETYHGNVPGINPLASDIDNPTVKNMQVLITDGDRDMILNSNGYEAIIVFKSKTNPLDLPEFASPETRTITTTSTLYKQLQVGLVIDGVDIAHTTAASRAAKRLPDVIDAGFTFTLAGSYSSQSIIRKTSKTVAGRRILKDSNNSTTDFDYLTMADASKTVFK